MATAEDRSEPAARQRAPRWLLWLVSTALALPGYAIAASGTGTIEIAPYDEAVRIDVLWTPDALRLELPGQADAYLLALENKAYSIGENADETLVLDMDVLRDMGGRQAVDAAGADLAPGKRGSLERLEATGEQETIAGIAGEVYRIAWTDGRGASHQDTLVLSEDPLARSLTRALGRANRALIGGGDDLFHQVSEARELGVLRFSESFELVELSGEPPSAELELPAEPMSLEEMKRRAQRR